MFMPSLSTERALVLIRTFACIWAIFLMPVIAGCGSDDEQAAGPSDPGPETGVVTAPPATGPEPEAGATGTGGDSPEDAPGGAGDEEAARSEARFALSGDGFDPDRVEVLPFLAIELVAVPEDGSFDISWSGPGGEGSASGTGEHRGDLDGLRPGARYTVRDEESGATAVIAAEAEPGP